MNGFNVDWASFPIIEVMSQARFGHKRIGYLAANQIFNEATDVILLTTNLFKKEFTSSSASSSSPSGTPYEVGMAINCLANIATKELARDCLADVVTLMAHQRPYVRKKAVLCLYKLFVKYPAGLRLTFDKLKDRLDDADMPVVSCAVNVICELAHSNPANYLPMAPKLFKLLTTSSNNWMLIKVVKLMASLVGEEPRLARKLLEPLSLIVSHTTAKSLQYECIAALCDALPHSRREDGSEAKGVAAAIALCSDTLAAFVGEQDQNLKYLGLVGLTNLLRSSPRACLEHRDAILRCLEDEDRTIRCQALGLLAGIVTRRSARGLIDHLRAHAMHNQHSHQMDMDSGYRDEVVRTVLAIGGRDRFSLVDEDAAWYIAVLLDLAALTTTSSSTNSKEVADQLVDLSMRCAAVRPYAVERCLALLLSTPEGVQGVPEEVLRGAAFVVGEYADLLTAVALDEEDDEEEQRGALWLRGPEGAEMRSLFRGTPVHAEVLPCLLSDRLGATPSGVQAALKVLAAAATSSGVRPQLPRLLRCLSQRLPLLGRGVHEEVQERAAGLHLLLTSLGVLTTTEAENEVDEEVYARGAQQAVVRGRALAAMVVSEQMTAAVHPRAQRRLPTPEGVQMDQPLSPSAWDKLMQASLWHPLGSGAAAEGIRLLEASAATDATPEVVQHREREREREKEVQSDHTTVSSGHTNTPKEVEQGGGSVFMLGGWGGRPSASAQQRQQQQLLLSRALADGMSDEVEKEGVRRHKHRSSSSKHRRGGVQGEVDRSDLVIMPVIRGSDSETEGTKGKGRTKGAKSSSKRKGTSLGTNGTTETEGLGEVDLRTPLRPEEVLYVPQHRTTSTVSTTSGVPAVIGGGAGGEDRRDKKRRDKDHKDKDHGSKERKHKHHSSKHHHDREEGVEDKKDKHRDKSSSKTKDKSKDKDRKHHRDKHAGHSHSQEAVPSSSHSHGHGQGHDQGQGDLLALDWSTPSTPPPSTPSGVLGTLRPLSGCTSLDHLQHLLGSGGWLSRSLRLRTSSEGMRHLATLFGAHLLGGGGSATTSGALALQSTPEGVRVLLLLKVVQQGVLAAELKVEGTPCGVQLVDQLAAALQQLEL